MQDTSIPDFDLPDPDGVCIAYGWGVKVHVRYGHLIVEDGIGRRRRQRRYARSTCPFDRLIVLGHSGYVTFEAVRWLQHVSAALIQIDSNGQLLASSGSLGTDRPDLRRAQALAIHQNKATEISRWLLQQKLIGQRNVVERLLVPADIDPQVIADAEVDEPRDLMAIEADAAHCYWKAWETVPVTFATRDRDRVPDHWHTFGSRRSPIRRTWSNASKAANPANAMLNYLYTILEAEARIACMAVGLDPGLGVLHADYRNRDSLALDIMEPVRPHIDRWLYDLLDGHHFKRSDFTETERGVCRILPPLTAILSGTHLTWRQHLAPTAEHVAQAIAGGNQDLPKLLTNANHLARYDNQPPEPAKVIIPAACRACGVFLPDGHTASLCEDCDQDRTCVICAASLAGKRVDAKYCSDRCQKKAESNRRRRKRREKRPDNCLHCGTSLKGYKASARYCGRACWKRAQRQNR